MKQTQPFNIFSKTEKKKRHAPQKVAKWAVKVFEKKILPRTGVVEIFLSKPVGLDLYCTILTL
ncbi:MAG: hypothetical protein LCH67_20300 [Bacteroidetes bacterium]|nr:hypothetical protein [Bacteroidota bacterium]